MVFPMPFDFKHAVVGPLPYEILSWALALDRWLSMLSIVGDGGGGLAGDFSGDNSMFCATFVCGGDGLNGFEVAAVYVDATVLVDCSVESSIGGCCCG